ncbi:hypothetical protein [Paenibacillus ihuae]|uniref:hypothetical protein n=1 Tax=Paenibacillus ihuae TaxID=1232431 RepID=UPI0006D56A37|nr:hypothetical protein [Paenibacillus ihuae]
MNTTLNSIFRPVGDPGRLKETKAPTKEIKSSSSSQKAQKASQRVRKVRSDKKMDIKFPVTPLQRQELRRLAKELRIQDKQPSKKYETISNTVLLKKAIDQAAIFPERYPPLLYTDTRQYMHVEPLRQQYELIEELAFMWNLSLRKTVYRLIMNLIYRGEVDIIANREGK